MYEYLKGIITKITAKYIVLEANGIGYILHVANPYTYSGQVNQEAQIYVHQVVREDAHLLYGFRSEDEKKLFLSLISVSGIGPVSALAIIAADDNAGLVQAIETKNITYLTKEVSIKKYRAELAIMMSCKRSIKANHRIDDHSARQLLYQLSQCDNPYNCPHGRPVLVHFTKSDMEKMFRRIQENHTSLRELGKY